MHPPFGFALFYLRGIADTLFKEGRIPTSIKSNDIYLGAIPWVVMQLVLVTIVIFVPQTVTMFLDKPEAVDLDKIQIEVPVDDNASLLKSPGTGEAGNDPFALPETEPSAEEAKKKGDAQPKAK